MKSWRPKKSGVVCMSEVACEDVANAAINAVKICDVRQDTEFAIMIGTVY